MPSRNPPAEKHNDPPRLDTQRIELLGRAFLTDQLIRGGLEVATPLRDRGVDLIAYADLTQEVGGFVSRPIQMKVASNRVFSLDRKYERIADLLIAFVWHINAPEQTRVYALSYADAFQVADEAGWTTTASWAAGSYATTKPSRAIEHQLERFRMTPARWFNAIVSTPLSMPSQPQSS